MIRVWRWMVWKMDFIFTGLSRNRHRIILVPGGWLLYEIGCSQGEDVAALLRKYKFEDIEIRQDLAGLDRVVLGRKKLQEDKYV
mgnify:CR=1 FL=1